MTSVSGLCLLRASMFGDEDLELERVIGVIVCQFGPFGDHPLAIPYEVALPEHLLLPFWPTW